MSTTSGNPDNAGQASALARSARAILECLFRGYRGGAEILLWNGERLKVGDRPAQFTLAIRTPQVFRGLALQPDPLQLVEAYFRGQIDIGGSIYAALGLRGHFEALRLAFADKLTLFKHALRLLGARGGRPPSPLPSHRSTYRHTRASDRRAIAAHYDLSNAFYALWLDPEMVYSCAYFERRDESLEAAQRRKLDLLCRKLRLQPGETLLDIGCGWGALACWAARHYGVHCHGVTLSKEQFDYAREKVRRGGLERQVTIELRDYRDVEAPAAAAGGFDKIVSVGMFEHVGLRMLPGYFATVRRLLKPGGLFLNHGISSASPGWRPGTATRFINRYVFPDGELDTVSNVQQVIEEAGFEVLDVENLRPHYALTLRHWVDRLEARRTEALRLAPESVYRIWRLYMAACALQFESGDTGVYQIVATPRRRPAHSLPLTRHALYA